jgi:hypothetical protein
MSHFAGLHVGLPGLLFDLYVAIERRAEGVAQEDRHCFQALTPYHTCHIGDNTMCTDVANAILDGTDCVMLSGEWAMGKYRVESVRMLARIASAI